MGDNLKGRAAKGVLWSAVERFSYQGIQFVLSFIIARQLLPEDYALIAMLAIFMAIAQSFIDSGFSNALIQKQNRTKEDLSTVFYFNIAVGVVMYLIFVAAAPYIASFYNQPILTVVIAWAGLNLIINSLAAVQRALLIIDLNFRKQSVISVCAVSVSGGIAVWMAYSGYGVWTLVVQTLLNGLITTLLLWITSKWRPILVFSKKSFKELFSFGSKLLMGGLLHTIYMNIYSLVIGKIFPAKELGLYNRATTLTQFPSTNITSVIDRVVYPLQCELQNDNERLTEKFYLFIRLTSYAVFPMMLGLAVVAEPFIKVVLTNKWIGAVEYIQILCMAYMWDPIMRMTWNLLNAKHRSDYSLKSEIIKKIGAVIILCASIPFGVKGMCIGLIVYSLFDLFVITQFAKRILPKVTSLNHFRNLFPILLQSSIMVAVVYVINSFIADALTQLIVGVCTGLVVYILLSLVICKREFNYVISLLKRK